MLKYLNFVDGVTFVLTSAADMCLVFVLQNLITKLEAHCVKI